MKVLILMGFYDIWCDIGILGVDGVESGDFIGFGGILVVVLIFKLVCG